MLRLVDDKTLAVNSAVIVEYLKALVKTNKISQYTSDGVVRYASHYALSPVGISGIKLQQDMLIQNKQAIQTIMHTAPLMLACCEAQHVTHSNNTWQIREGAWLPIVQTL